MKSVKDQRPVNRSDANTTSEREKPSDYPKQFGHYEILRELGKGGMATVYLAVDTRLQRKVALKVPHKSVAADPEYMTRFLREARSAATLHHPNICTIFEASEIGGTPYMTMALVEGQSLTELIEQGQPLSIKRAADIVRKIALAMDFAHSNGIIHRDLKPSNIMLDVRKEPIIMDFGLARQEDKEDSRLTQDGLLIGTPIYMAPEVAKKGAGLSGTITDVYSLGAILYELIAGRPPYKGTVQAVLVQVIRGQPKPPSTYRSDLNPALEAICLKAMAKDPKERYPTMKSFAGALTDFLKDPEGSSVAAVEVVEEAAPAVVEEEPPADVTPTRRRPASSRGQSSARSSARLSRATARPKADGDSIRLVATLIGVCVLAIVVVIGAIVALKKSRKDSPDPTPVETQAPAPTKTETAEQKPPEPPPVTNFPMVESNGVTVGQKDWRIAIGHQGTIPIQFKEITSPGGWHRFKILKITVNGQVLVDETSNEEWTKEDAQAEPKTINPVYQIPVEWLGPLEEGKKVELKMSCWVVFPVNLINVSRDVTLHVVKPE